MILILLLLESAHVGSQAKVAYGLQKTISPDLVLNLQSALLEQCDLSGNINDRFVKNSHARKPPGKKNPLNLCLAAVAVIGMAGVLRARPGTRALLCKFFAAPAVSGDGRASMRDLAT
ncbi:hypothetical protein ACFZAC_10335 [Pseudomonas fluorescens]|uniref:hypothetical protein n=1 Tax=Pseudomonas fluorescens TaxID=294 RepID=UPI003747BCB4